MAHRAAEQLTVLFDALYEYVHFLAHTLRDTRRARCVGKVAQDLRALGLDVLVDLARQLVCGRALLARVREDADVVEKSFGDEIAQLFELVFRFARESCD